MTNKSAIAQNFSDAAPHYDEWAVAQEHIAAQLCRKILPDSARSILDIGCGTGMRTHQLKSRYPEACIHATDLAPGMIAHCNMRWPDRQVADFNVADADSLDAPGAYDLIASSCSFQWFAQPHDTLRRIRNALADSGRLALAVPVAGSFHELHESWRAAGLTGQPGLNLWTEDAYHKACASADLPIRTSTIEDVVVRHPSPWHALRSFHRIGALLNHAPLPPSALRKLVTQYSRNFTTDNAQVTLTYRVLYVTASRNS